jgi:phosphomevalonate kinase
VLHGAPAVSVAVDRVVRARVGGPRAESPFVAAALEIVGARELEVAVDSSELYDGPRKIGLGSSAAVTVAVVGAALHASGRSLADRRRIFELADEAHGRAAARGSGIDVATAVWGGAIRFQRKQGAVEVVPVDLPDGVRLTFVFTGQSASTPELLGRVKSLAEAAPARHAEAIARLTAHANAFAAAVANHDASSLLVATDAYREAMAALGDAAATDIVTREHRELARIAQRHGGAAKPSGAGGGDLGVVFTVGAERTLAVREELQRAGLPPLVLGAPAPGLRLENV